MQSEWKMKQISKLCENRSHENRKTRRVSVSMEWNMVRLSVKGNLQVECNFILKYLKQSEGNQMKYNAELSNQNTEVCNRCLPKMV